MSLHDYLASRELELQDPPFYGLVMAAMRRADTGNLAKLRMAFPDVWAELNERYNLPGGGLRPGERHPTTGYRRDADGQLYGPNEEAIL